MGTIDIKFLCDKHMQYFEYLEDAEEHKRIMEKYLNGKCKISIQAMQHFYSKKE